MGENSGLREAMIEMGERLTQHECGDAQSEEEDSAYLVVSHAAGGARSQQEVEQTGPRADISVTLPGSALYTVHSRPGNAMFTNFILIKTLSRVVNRVVTHFM